MVDHPAHGNDEEAPGQGALGEAKEGERIAKVLARAGVASRREVERLIAAGRVTLNGERLTTPAVKVGRADVVKLDGAVVGAAEVTRLIRYHKPPGLLTSHHDPKGRPTVFDALPAGLPRLISVGRLDLNSEGLLLLTNDGGLARSLELPSSGIVRRYRARAHGRIDQTRLDALTGGITAGGVRYGPIRATLDPGKEGAANVWITLELSEGKNREVRRVLEALGLTVNRLIRLAYGPFELGDLKPGQFEEVGPGVIRQRLHGLVAPASLPSGEAAAKYKPGWAKPKIRPKPASSSASRSSRGPSRSRS
jgi:23S rRNA pseudouridine2605 synthase